MSSSPLASLLDVELQRGKPPILRAEATGDAAGWAAEHRDVLRAVVAEHGAVLVRGLGLRDAAEIREYLVDVYGAEGLPFNTGFGTGEPLTEEIVEQINSVYEAKTVREPWQAGDLMLVDNIRTAHSREAYEGPREILVGMAEPVRLSEASPIEDVTPR